MIYGGAKPFLTLNITTAMSCSLRVYSVCKLALCKSLHTMIHYHSRQRVTLFLGFVLISGVGRVTKMPDSLTIAMFPVTSRTGHEGLFISVVGKNTTWLNVSY